MEPYETLEFDHGIKAHIIQDMDPMDPRKEWDHVATMICGHRRYELGDVQANGDMTLLENVLDHANKPMRCLRCKREVDNVWGNYGHFEIDADGNEQLEETCGGEPIELDMSEFVILPLYLFDHSGLSISTSSRMFSAIDSAGWDWGLLGVIYMHFDDIKKAYMLDVVSDSAIEQAKQLMIAEVQEYDQYLTGDVFGYSIEDAKGDTLDACWGFYGVDFCISQAKEAAEFYVKEAEALAAASKLPIIINE